MSESTEELAEEIAALAQRTESTVAVAESLTAGQIAAAFGAAPDSGDWFRGGVVAYSRYVKHHVLDVPEGPVVSRVSAEAMARTVRSMTDATIAVGVTGVGGPDRQDDEPPGTVWFAIAVDDAPVALRRQFEGEPGEVLDQTIDQALELVLAAMKDPAGLPELARKLTETL
ncbi:nicotinamide-nucleotide amidase [Nocardia tenerifensis]|uniref:Nicotinamide-nucleotide amidase n=1 Tax=Nocardia tenerifensis TaxID=228006 RepID=A0A318KE60_9NOCA|nr:CinA family protein [Nocardia tenerifensis]PXX71215.1 nicotinamide-nucleotide amidase [Nocardia tenerifensis]